MVLAPYRLDSGELTGFERSTDCEIPALDLICQCGMRKNKAGFALFRRSVLGDMRWEGKNLDFVFYRRAAARTRLFFVAAPAGAYHLDIDTHSMTRRRKIPSPELSVQRARVMEGFLGEFGETMLAKCPSLYGFYAYGAAVGLLLGGETTRARRPARGGGAGPPAGGAARCQPRPKYVLFYMYSLLPFSSALLWLLFSIKRALQKVL